MGRRKVVEITCDRCGRIETQTEKELYDNPPEFHVAFHGKVTEYGDLCRMCRRALQNGVAKLIKDEGKEEKDGQPKRNLLGLTG